MSHSLLAPGAQPCVWMSAGVLRYRLCTRNLECDGCLLDAALRADPVRLRTGGGPTPDPQVLPSDRLYSPGHLWLRRSADDPERFRVGLDAFAVALLDEPPALAWPENRADLAPGGPLFTLEVGAASVPLPAPVGGLWIRGNELLRGEPGRLLRDPYRRGWIGEVTVEPGDLTRLWPPSTARRRLGDELRSFRQALAAALLTDGGDVPLDATDPGGGLTSLPRLLGAPGYAALLGALLINPSSVEDFHTCRRESRHSRPLRLA